jgi:hypothetical protein
MIAGAAAGSEKTSTFFAPMQAARNERSKSDRLNRHSLPYFAPGMIFRSAKRRICCGVNLNIFATSFTSRNGSQSNGSDISPPVWIVLSSSFLLQPSLLLDDVLEPTLIILF